MNLNKVLFIGGNPRKFGSVEIRCEDIAPRLGCDRMLSVRKVEEIPDVYSAFVCVKPALRGDEILKLSKRGPVIWDIVDDTPPASNICAYIVSTQGARRVFQNYGRIEIIPHHHCNFSGSPNPIGCRHPVWIGQFHWCPELSGFEFEKVNTLGMNSEQTAAAYRRAGIGLNLRSNHPNSHFHVPINAGIKLINCIGFGIPSISSDEPAYHEIGDECTVFSTASDCSGWVSRLQNDDAFYSDLREKCISRARDFHVSSIIEKYRALLESL